MRYGSCRIAVAVCALIVFSSCSGPSTTPSPSPDLVNEVTAGDQVLFTHSTPPDGAMDSALLGGTLSLADSCLGVRTDQQAFHVVLFPAGTTWIDATSVRVGEETFDIGDAVDLSGGMTSGGQLLERVQNSCPTASDQVFNAGAIDGA